MSDYSAELYRLQKDINWLKDNVGKESIVAFPLLASNKICDMTVAKQMAACCSDGVQKIYVSGGYTTASVNTFEAFDIVSKTWTTLATIPTATHYHTSEYWNGKVYIFCTPSSFQSVSIYDIATNSWTAGTNCPIQIYAHASCIDNTGNVYISGGAVTAKNKIYKYSTTADTWTEMATMAVDRYHHSMVFKDDFLYIFGRLEDSSSEKYDIENDTISSITNLATHTATYNNAVVMDDKILILGTATNNSIIQYFPDTNTYGSMKKTSTTYTRNGFTFTYAQNFGISGLDHKCSCVCDDKIYVFGGESSGTLYSGVYELEFL